MATGPNNKGLSADEKALLNARAKLIDDASKNLESYLKALNDVGVLENHINEAIKQRAKLNKDNAELRVKIANTSGQEQAILKKQLQDGQKLLITSSKRINQAKEEVKFQKEALATVKQRVVLALSTFFPPVFMYVLKPLKLINIKLHPYFINFDTARNPFSKSFFMSSISSKPTDSLIISSVKPDTFIASALR